MVIKLDVRKIFTGSTVTLVKFVQIIDTSLV